MTATVPTAVGDFELVRATARQILAQVGSQHARHVWSTEPHAFIAGYLAEALGVTPELRAAVARLNRTDADALAYAESVGS